MADATSVGGPTAQSPGSSSGASLQRGDDHPSGDERFGMLDASMKRHRFAQDALIEILHVAQELFGHLEPDLLYYIAQKLKLPPSRVYGVASFYHLFTFTQPGEHTCLVCTGTACYVKGAEDVLQAIERELGTMPGRTTADGRISLSTARCVGACGLAPLVIYDGEVAGMQTPEDGVEHLKGWGVDGSR